MMDPITLERIQTIRDPQQRLHQFWSLSDEEDFKCFRSFCREYTLDCFEDAHVVYKKTWLGLTLATCAAIGVGKRFYDDDNQLERKQSAIQLVTDWRRVDHQQPHVWQALLWYDAHFTARLEYRKRNMLDPRFDFRLECALRAEQEQNFTPQ